MNRKTNDYGEEIFTTLVSTTWKTFRLAGKRDKGAATVLLRELLFDDF